MCRGTSVLRLSIVLLCVFVLFAMQQKVKFLGRFDQMSHISDGWRCIPLWYPYFMFECFREVSLENVEKWYDASYSPGGNGLGKGENSLYVRDKNQLDEWLLQNWVTDVKKFRHLDGVLAGVRVVNTKSLDFFFPESGPWTNYVAYFVFATNMEKAVQFRSKDAYLEKCREYGVDGDDLKTFDENFRDYKLVRGAASGFSNVVRTNFASGVSPGEWVFHIVCAAVGTLVAAWPLVPGKRKRMRQRSRRRA